MSFEIFLTWFASKQAIFKAALAAGRAAFSSAKALKNASEQERKDILEALGNIASQQANVSRSFGLVDLALRDLNTDLEDKSKVRSALKDLYEHLNPSFVCGELAKTYKLLPERCFPKGTPQDAAIRQVWDTDSHIYAGHMAFIKLFIARYDEWTGVQVVPEIQIDYGPDPKVQQTTKKDIEKLIKVYRNALQECKKDLDQLLD